MVDLLALPQVRARMRRWTVAEYIALAEDNPAFRGFELIRGFIVEKCRQVLYTPPAPILLARTCDT